MRPIDADQLLDFIRFDERVIAPEEHTAQDIVMMIQTAPTIAPPPNDPLTIEELREMDGEPVYVSWPGYNHIGWALVHVWSKRENAVYLTYSNGASDQANYVLDNAKIYRRRPEEGTT